MSVDVGMVDKVIVDARSHTESTLSSITIKPSDVKFDFELTFTATY